VLFGTCEQTVTHILRIYPSRSHLTHRSLSTSQHEIQKTMRTDNTVVSSSTTQVASLSAVKDLTIRAGELMIESFRQQGSGGEHALDARRSGTFGYYAGRELHVLPQWLALCQICCDFPSARGRPWRVAAIEPPFPIPPLIQVAHSNTFGFTTNLNPLPAIL
jgi:hypothetical protein